LVAPLPLQLHVLIRLGMLQLQLGLQHLQLLPLLCVVSIQLRCSSYGQVLHLLLLLQSDGL